MDYDGGFHEVETDGKLFLVYHHPKYLQIKSTSSPDEVANQDHPPLPLFLCPVARARKDKCTQYGLFMLTSSPEYVISTIRTDNLDDHHALPLFWCNNEKFGKHGRSCICSNSILDTYYYCCDNCGLTFHKECVEAPQKIKHPYYPRHSLELCFYNYGGSGFDCSCCGREIDSLMYHSTFYQTSMHPICAMKSIPVTVDQQKIHIHPLTFFPRQNSLICNVCGLIEKYATYVCLRCNFVAHKDCMYFPHTIKISRHHHRISQVSSLRDGKWPCGVCRQTIDSDYGAYTCNRCGDYAVHSRCALGKDVWDGEELEGIPETYEDDITQDAPPFCKISKGVIQYFLHDHHLQLEENILYDESKLCEACVMPVFEDKLYSCMECDFILHETCLKARRRVQHALHPHLLILKAINNGSGYFQCDACFRSCGGFVYECPKEECEFKLDVRCASISEPFDYQGHEHPLFLSLGPEKDVLCKVCKNRYTKLLNCIKCDFIMCMECATLPYKARYKSDKHFLTLSWGEERCDWCEECEDIVETLFYWCNDCCTILHTACLFSKDIYLKPGQCFETYRGKVQILAKSNNSRPICDYCMKLCQFKIFTIDNRTTCSRICAFFIH